MQWYYARDGEQVGPLSEEDFQARVASGEIRGETLVWNETLTEWTPYARVRGDNPPPAEEAGGVQVQATVARTAECAECGRTFPADQLVPLGGRMVCAACKPIVLKKLEEGLDVARDWHYGGFWMRAVAKITDAIIRTILQFAVGIPLGLVLSGGAAANPAVLIGAGLAKVALSLGVNLGYYVFFVGRYQATPGKMICGLKIICADGSRVSYARAAGRFFAEILSGLIFGIGYIMAAFDEEKRTLHDRICGTRVVYR